VSSAASGAAASAATPSFSTLSAGQVKARSSGKRERMLVVFKDQLGTLPANPVHRHAREAAATAMQAPLVAQLKQVRATHVTKLSLLNSVSATIPAAEAKALANNPGIKEVVPDENLVVGGATPTTPAVPASRVKSSATPATGADGQQLCNAQSNKPLLEPEGLTSVDDASADPNAHDEASSIATGEGVIVGNINANSMAGNANMIRPDGQPVIIDAPDPTENAYDPEANGDVATIAAQGTVTYSYASQLPFSNLPANCSFRIVGDAPGASILSTGAFSNTDSSGQIVAPASQVMAGLQQAVSEGADVVSESYGFEALPSSQIAELLESVNAAMEQAGVVVVEAAGDSGSSGTVAAPASDPNVIDVAGTNDLRLFAQAYGYQGWEDDSMATLSSGGTAPQGDVVDLAAPANAGLAPVGAGADPPLPTEVFGGTSQAAPFVAGAAADVIQAYRDTHGGATPTPAQVKEILTSTATDIGADADQQGAGLVNVYAAVEAARQMPGTSEQHSNTAALVDSPTQLDVQGDGGSTVTQSVTLYNASSNSETVTGTYRALGSETSLGTPVTENVSAPLAGAPIPAQGAAAAAPIHFTVPAGTDVLDADMRWPDATNNDDSALAFILTDPAGKLAQISYNFGGGNGPNASPDIQHSTVEHPMAGTWTAQIVWANGTGDGVDTPPIVPGPYTGTVTFQAGGQNFTTTPASAPVTIAPRSSVNVPLNITLPNDPGDAPESVQFTSPDGLSSSVPIARRTLIPSAGGSFSATLTSSVSRGPGQIKTFFVNVPPGEKDLDVSLNAPDHNPNDPVYYYLSGPGNQAVGLFQIGNSVLLVGTDDSTDETPTPENPSGNAALFAPDPRPGLWEIDVMQGATTDGTEFSQTVQGTVAYNQLQVSETGLPTSTPTIPRGSSVPLAVQVTNTTERPESLYLIPGEAVQDSNGNNVVVADNDVNGDDLATSPNFTPVKVAPGATGTLTATLSPETDAFGNPLAAGDTVNDILMVYESTGLQDFGPGIGLANVGDPALFTPVGLSLLHTYHYSYTVGAPLPAPLAASFNNTGISDDDNTAAGNLDGAGFSYSEQALTAAGLAPGAQVTSDGVQYQWPNVAAGQPDNVTAQGQVISVPPVAGATELGLMGTATDGPSTGTMTITYTDGTTQPATLGLTDWTTGDPLTGNTTVVTMPYRNDATDGSSDQVGTRVFSTTIPLQPDKTVASVTLPSHTDQGDLHVFAIGTDAGPLTTN